MSFEAKIEPRVALIGNQIRVIADTVSEDSIRMTISNKGMTIYEAAAVPAGNGQCVFTINDIFQDYFQNTPLGQSKETLIKLPLEIFEYSVLVEGQTKSATFVGKCYPGGISKRLSRFLAQQGTDIFTAKLLNHRANFLLTTRSDRGVVGIRETEIGYLYFINQGFPLEISDCHGHKITVNPTVPEAIYALNLLEIRNQFLRAGVLASYFRIAVKNKTSVAIAILPGHENAIVLAFRNTFGMFENIELSGTVNIQPELKKRETTNTFDQSIYDFTGQVERGEYAPVITVESGYKTDDELNFIQDLLCSDDVYLRRGEELIRVTVSSTKLKYQTPASEPTSVEIKITFCDTESYSSLMQQTDLCFLVNKETQPITSQERKLLISKKH